MGYAKNQATEKQEGAEEAWARKAESNDYRCKDCNELITYVDREQYFVTKQCGDHAHRAKQNDQPTPSRES